MISTGRILLCLLVAFGIIFAGCVSVPGTGIPGITLSPAVLSSVPDVRQSTPFSSGAASLQAVLNYWGTDLSEEDLMDLLELGATGNVLPESIVDAAQHLNYSAELRENLTLSDLEASVTTGIPVIIAAQAHAGNESILYTQEWEKGHYMVVIGIDAENVYLEDPAILGSRGMIPRLEFLTRWHDAPEYSADDPGSRKYQHPGIFINDTVAWVHPAFVRVE